MLDRGGEISNDDVKDWLSRHVAPEIEDLKSADIEAEHTTESNRGVLAWIARYYIEDDPESLSYPDGSSDGGIDIASLGEIESNYTARIYQLTVPSLDKIAAGRIVKAREKFADDVRRVRKTITGETRKLKALNLTAREVVRRIGRMREAVAEGGDARLTIEIHPLSLKEQHPDAARELRELSEEARNHWSTAEEHWIVRPARDVKDLYAAYQLKRPAEESPERLRLRLFGTASHDHPKRGPFLCFLSAADLVEAYEKWGAGLLDANLRYPLGNTEVNKIIQGALERISGVRWFHESNNGIVITCTSFTVSASHATLTAPQVVNGGQTLYSILTVLKELEEIPREQLGDGERRRLTAIRDELKLSARIIVVQGPPERTDRIAIASNTQNRLSDRTMHSSWLEMRDLRLRMAKLTKPWFVITKDGEWEALRKSKPLLQSKTGNRQVRDFLVSGKRYRKVENVDLGVSMLAFWGFASDAKPSRIFVKRYFRPLFNSHPDDSKWRELARKRVEWDGEAFRELFVEGQAPAFQWLLASFAWSFWREYTFPESKQLLLAYEEEGIRDPGFRASWFKGGAWDVPDSERDKLLQRSESSYWIEQVAKSAYLVLVYQTMRVLVRAFGELDESRCGKILDLPQFSQLSSGEPIDVLGDFRTGSISDGPFSAIGKMLHYACKLLWITYETQVRHMASRQQVLLQEEWVARLSDQVDKICSRVGEPAFRHAAELEGPDDKDIGTSSLEHVLTAAVAPTPSP